jgi:hypothetical protein
MHRTTRDEQYKQTQHCTLKNFATRIVIGMQTSIHSLVYAARGAHFTQILLFHKRMCDSIYSKFHIYSLFQKRMCAPRMCA